MLDLKDNNLSYILCSADVQELSQIDNDIRNKKMVNLLYGLDYSLMAIPAYAQDLYEKNYLAFNLSDNDKIRKDAILLIKEFYMNEIIVKYKNNDLLTKIKYDGSEVPVDIVYYDNDLDRKKYIYETLTFCLYEKKRYFFPKKKEDFKQGMILEYCNNNKWYTKEIVNLESEYDKMYKILSKHEKIRIPV
jgi:hypothetical protein